MFGTVFNAVDIAALMVVFGEVLLGLRRKLSGEWLRLVNTALVLWVSARFYQPLARLLADNTRLSDQPEWALAVAFPALVLAGGLVLLGLRLLLTALMKLSFHERVDPIGGGFAGLLRGSLWVILVVFAAGLWPSAPACDLFVRHSLAGRSIHDVAPAAVRFLGGEDERMARVQREAPATEEARPEKTRARKPPRREPE